MNIVYNIYLDIGSWTTPVVGSGRVLSTTAIYSDLELETYIEKPTIVRTKVNGNISFTGDEYDTLKSLESTTYEIPIRIQEVYTSNYAIDSILKLKGNFKDDIKQVTCEILTEDNYTKLLNDPVVNIDTEFEIVGNVQVRSIEAEKEAGGYFGFENCYLIKDIIEYIVGEIDSTIIFSASSFSIFDKTGNTEIKYLHLEQMRDFSNEMFVEGKDAKESIKIKLSEIFEYFENFFSTYWRITDTKEFRFTHLPDYVYGSGIDFDTDFANFIPHKEYEYDSKKISIFERKIPEDNPNPDFKGLDILFSQVADYQKQDFVSRYYTDLWSIFAEGKSISSDFFLFAIQKITSDQYQGFTNQRWDGSAPIAGTTLDTFSDVAGTLTIASTSAADKGCYMFLYAALPNPFLIGDTLDYSFNVSTFSSGAPISFSIFGYTAALGKVAVETISVTATGVYSDTIDIPLTYEQLWVEFYSSNTFSSIIDTFVFNRNLNRCIKDTSILDAGDKMNMPVSLAYIDENFFAKGSEKTGNINGVIKNNLFKINDKRVISVDIPIRANFDDINFNEEHTIFSENVLLESHKRKLDGSFDSLEFFINDN